MKWLMILCLGCPMLGVAQSERLAADRPDQTESAATVPVGTFQMESGFVGRPVAHRPDGLDLPAVLLRLGLGEHVELRAEGGATRFADIDDETEWQAMPPEISLKVGMGNGGATGITTAVLAKLGVPRWAGEEEGHPYPVLVLAADRDLGERAGIGANIGMEWNGFDAAPTTNCSLSGAMELTGQLGAFAELYSAFSEGGEGDHRWDFGTTWAIGNDVQLDASAGNGFQDQGWFFGAGVSFRVGLW